MPITIPPFVTYQAPLIPITARWRHAPPEGDKYVPVEIDWGLTVAIGKAVQISLNAGPVEFSQIVALSVDNGRSGGDVAFVFPDTGRQLAVPAYSQGVYPVFTNSLTFYVLAESAAVGDITEFEILNSLPPPVAVQPSQEQTAAGITGASTSAVGSRIVIPPGINGTLTGYQILLVSTSTLSTASAAACQLIDGTGQILWLGESQCPATGSVTTPINAAGLRVRFTNGINFQVTSTSLPAGCYAQVNLYFSVP